MAEVGRTLADRLNNSMGPTAVLIPNRGWSVYGAEGGPLHDPQSYGILTRALKERLRPDIRCIEMEAHINEPGFVNRGVDLLLGFMEGTKR